MRLVMRALVALLGLLLACPAEAATTVTRIDHGKAWLVTFDESNVATGDELVVDGGFPAVVTITDFDWELVSGSGSTVTPGVATAASSAAGDADREVTYTGAGHGHDNTRVRICRVSAGTLYVPLEPNAGTDNRVVGAFVVYAGHAP